jgi:hypothetical protein
METNSKIDAAKNCAPLFQREINFHDKTERQIVQL